MPYRAPVSDLQFILQEVVDFEKVLQLPAHEELDQDVVSAIFEEAAKLSNDVLAPLNSVGDTTPGKLVDGGVVASPGFDNAIAQVGEGGWIGMLAKPENGGMGLPLAVATSVNEMMAGANLALSLFPLMSQGQIEALETHATQEVQEKALPQLIAGTWSGTMNLTEPSAGSDVGALVTKASPNGDGSYSISGQKIFITWGDNQFSDNISHLVLARLPDSAPGTKGISLFLVPKFLPNESGQVGNGVSVAGLEHKLGIHGSPTCVMSYENAKGWLVGQENEGMKCMFTMMNNARLGVAVQGVGVAEAATQKALEYAEDRVQGKSPIGREKGTIIDHADVRRMLATMRAETFAARSIALACGTALDLGSTDPDQAARGALLIPIAKAFGTDIGHEVAQMGVQVHGGMGYIEETGAAQLARDARITSIYEGTNGIQAMDLVGRKLMDGGEAAFALLDEVEKFAEAARAKLPKRAKAVWEAAETLREAVETLVAMAPNDRFAGAVPFLRAFARVLGGHYHLKAAIAEGGEGKRSRLAAFYIQRLLPEYLALLQQARLGGEDVYALSPEDLKTE